jgi:hypothetical protein
MKLRLVEFDLVVISTHETKKKKYKKKHKNKKFKFYFIFNLIKSNRKTKEKNIATLLKGT